MTDHLPGASGRRSAAFRHSPQPRDRATAQLRQHLERIAVAQEVEQAAHVGLAEQRRVAAGLEKVTVVSGSEDHHRVTVGVEAVPLGHRVRVRGLDQLAAGEGAHQHQQGGAGQVEVGEQAIHHAEVVARA